MAALILPTHITYAAAGSPSVDGATCSGTCAICGATCSAGVEYRRWQGSGFTGQTALARPGSAIVCAACVWSTSWVAPPGYPVDPAKPKGPRLSQFCHLWDAAGGYWYAERGERARIREWIAARGAEPWFAALATDGKKHSLPYTPVNLPGARPARIQLGEETADLPAWEMVGAMDALLDAGASRREIASGEYHALRWRDAGDDLLAFEAAHGARRHSATFRAALCLADETRAPAAPEPTEDQPCLPLAAGS